MCSTVAGGCLTEINAKVYQHAAAAVASVAAVVPAVASVAAALAALVAAAAVVSAAVVDDVDGNLLITYFVLVKKSGQHLTHI